MLATFITAMRGNASSSLVSTSPTTLNLWARIVSHHTKCCCSEKSFWFVNRYLVFHYGLFSEIVLQQEVATASAEIRATVIIF